MLALLFVNHQNCLESCPSFSYQFYEHININLTYKLGVPDLEKNQYFVVVKIFEI